MCFDTYWYTDYIHLKSGPRASGDEVIETIKTLWKDKRYDPSTHHVWDFSKTQEFTLRTADLQSLLDTTRDRCLIDNSASAAIIAPKPSIFYRMQAVVSYPKKRPCNSKVFANLDTACNWLGISA